MANQTDACDGGRDSDATVYRPGPWGKISRALPFRLKKQQVKGDNDRAHPVFAPLAWIAVFVFGAIFWVAVFRLIF